MLTEDYIMRMINLAIAAMMRAIGLRQDGEYVQAHQVTEQAMEQITGLPYEILQNLEDRVVLDMLSIQDSLDVERVLVISELYQEQGEIFQAQERLEAAVSNWKTALFLLLEAGLSLPKTDAASLQNKIETLVEKCLSNNLPFDTCFSLFNYYETIGCYSKALQILQQLAENTDYQPELKNELKLFYLRLLEMPDEELNHGGLTKSQVKQLFQQNQF